MSDIAIRVENLGKRYRIGTRKRQNTLRDTIAENTTRLANGVTHLGSRLLHSRNGHTSSANGDSSPETFWALRDVSFEIKQGEVVGVIGRNGAGKSTLLKILSRITKPTTGEAEIFGRVGSLLEVGTGFHAELTGRENIYMNGAMLGMRRSEINRKFDEIVAFAEVEKFIDTPVKRYSSGMYVRLAFAVAAHLEPEILLVDEVLAVGDTAFQRKCLGKMGDVAKEGRTVLFVSHNMAAVRSLCTSADWLSGGLLVREGRVADVIEEYITSTMSRKNVALRERKDRRGNGNIFLTSLSITSLDSVQDDSPIYCTDRLKIEIEYQTKLPLRNLRFLLSINDLSNSGIYFLDSDVVGGLGTTLPKEGRISCITGPINITPGECYVNIAAMDGNRVADHIEYASNLTIEPLDFFGTGKLPNRQNGICLIGQSWMCEQISNEN